LWTLSVNASMSVVGRSDRRWRSWVRDAGAGKARLTAVGPGPPNWICADDSQSKCGAIQTIVVQSVSGTAVALRLHLGTAALVVQPWKQYEAMARCYGAGPHRAPWHTRIHQVPCGKHPLRSPAVHAASARAYCALNVRRDSNLPRLRSG
jgi:hypothetical protein